MWFLDEEATIECEDHNLVIPALGHDEVTDEGYAANCSESGLTDGEHCNRCGKILVKQKKIPPVGHVDQDGDHYCDVCNTYLKNNPKKDR